jgi:hypothetical protein
MILSGNEAMLKPIVETIHKLVDQLSEEGHADARLHQDTLTLVLMALGDALMGAPMAKALGLPRDSARNIAERLLLDSLTRATGPAPIQTPKKTTKPKAAKASAQKA